MMTRTEAINFVINEINKRGLFAKGAEIEQGFVIVRILGSDQKTVCGSITLTDNEIAEGNTTALTAKILDGLRAAIKEPILKALNESK